LKWLNGPIDFQAFGQFERHRGAISVRPIFRKFLFVYLCLGVSAVAAGDDVISQMEERVQACTPCHGLQGRGTNDPYFPRLAGKPAGYIFNQLTAFKAGRRKYPPMNYLLQFLPDAYLKQMAEYFAAQRPPLPEFSPPEASSAVMARGEALVTEGDPDQGIPACSSCHGVELTGQEPAIPGLLGLRAAYISAQLGGWRYGTRTSIQPDCMQVVAGHLTEEDVTAVAAWLSGQKAPPNRNPAPVGSYSLPLTCGSQPEGLK
jgi:cytochrome c553